MALTLDSTVWLETQQFAEAQEGEVLYAMNHKTGSYLYLNEVATIIWQQLKNPVRVSSICQNLEQSFAVSSSDCQAEVLRILGQLERLGSLNIQ